jgi:hypothetical protein
MYERAGFVLKNRVEHIDARPLGMEWAADRVNTDPIRPPMMHDFNKVSY